MRRAGHVAAVLALVASGACSDRRPPPVAVQENPLMDRADQVMFGINTILTDRGVRQAVLRADTAFFFDEGTRIELRGVHLTFYTTEGVENAVLTSREGTYDTRASQTEARGNVVVISQRQNRRLTTEQLRYDQSADLISSDSAFVLTEPTRRLSGVGFTSDPEMRRVRVARVRGGSGEIVIPEGQ
ncbi:MAG TPA: LPS export ABC transporter periplasmic protein LptC [Gemmatimonadaceae bacterium]|nr:LPS export ABC transporter periplasmic protein LptC [Gemmatimonadaceae bacterium]